MLANNNIHRFCCGYTTMGVVTESIGMCMLLSPVSSQIAKFMRSTWGPPGSFRPQMGPMNLAIRDMSRIHSSRPVDWRFSWEKYIQINVRGSVVSVIFTEESGLHEVRFFVFWLILRSPSVNLTAPIRTALQPGKQFVHKLVFPFYQYTVTLYLQKQNNRQSTQRVCKANSMLQKVYVDIKEQF